MVGPGQTSPDWREASGYAPLAERARSVLAWEWLRRDETYRAAWRESGQSLYTRESASRTGPTIRTADPAAARWGLHAFENPDLPTVHARPMWRRALYPATLAAFAKRDGAERDRFDLGRFAAIATVVTSGRTIEHILLSDGLSSLRLDVTGRSLVARPGRLTYDLAGLSGVRPPLDTLTGLLRLWESGRLPPPVLHARTARIILFLRVWDALRAGASQRTIAQVLLTAEAAELRWRSGVPSVRSRAQRLVRAARAFAAGHYRTLLSAG